MGENGRNLKTERYYASEKAGENLQRNHEHSKLPSDAREAGDAWARHKFLRRGLATEDREAFDGGFVRCAAAANQHGDVEDAVRHVHVERDLRGGVEPAEAVAVATGVVVGQGLSPIVNTDEVGRNEACPCGSGKKYKKCHGV